MASAAPSGRGHEEADATAILDFIRDRRLLKGPREVCAGPPHLIRDVVEICICGERTTAGEGAADVITAEYGHLLAGLELLTLLLCLYSQRIIRALSERFGVSFAAPEGAFASFATAFRAGTDGMAHNLASFIRTSLATLGLTTTIRALDTFCDCRDVHELVHAYDVVELALLARVNELQERLDRLLSRDQYVTLTRADMVYLQGVVPSLAG